MSEDGGKRPNILYIMTDDHGTGGLSCYGSKVNQTPNMDRIANEGLRLDNCYVTYSLCSPSRAAILTGKYAHKNGQTSIGGNVFDGSQQTFPSLLRGAGYETAIIGKWHLHCVPNWFDYYSVMWQQGSYFDPKFIEESEEGPVWKANIGYSSDLVVDKCLDWLDRKRNSEKPFMLLCHFKSPHYNWEPDEKHQAMYEDLTMPEPESFDHSFGSPVPPERLQVKLETVHEQWKITHWDDMPEGMSPQEQKKWNYQRFLKDYLRCVASVDDNIGRLLKYLDEQGLTENTVVVYTSDNGMFQGEHGWVDKKMMYEESLRVPFLIRYPKLISPGTTSNGLVTNCDYAPTFLELAGEEVPEDIQGTSFVRLLDGDVPEDWRSVFYYQHFDTSPDGELANCGVRMQEFKLIWYNHNFDNYQLFDLRKDPYEMNDVYGDPEYAPKAEEMKSLLHRERERIGLTDEVEDRIFSGEGSADARRQIGEIVEMIDANSARLEGN